MSSGPIDYEEVVADLERKRAAFNSAVDSAINGIRHVLAAISALPAAGLSVPYISSAATTGAPTLTPDAFFGLGIAEAAMKYLQIIKRQQTSREIADALEAAGYHHTSQNFMNTVNTALYRRSKDEGDVLKIGRNWALTEWYPGRRRAISNLRDDDSSQIPDTDLDTAEGDPL